MYKKAWCTCKVVVLRNKAIAFLTSYLPSPSSLLKLPIHFRDGPNRCSHCTITTDFVWYKIYPTCDAPFSRSARRSFAPSKSLRHNRSFVWTKALSGMIFVATQTLSGIMVWTKPTRAVVLDLSHKQPNNFFQIIAINKPIRSRFPEEMEILLPSCTVVFRELL